MVDASGLSCGLFESLVALIVTQNRRVNKRASAEFASAAEFASSGANSARPASPDAAPNPSIDPQDLPGKILDAGAQRWRGQHFDVSSEVEDAAARGFEGIEVQLQCHPAGRIR